MKDKHTSLRPLTGRAFWGIFLFVMAGVLVTFAVFWYLRKSELAAYQNQFERAVSSRAQLFIQRMEEDTLALNSLTSLLDDPEVAQATHFNDLATKLLAERKEIWALAWAPHIEWAQRAEGDEAEKRDGADSRSPKDTRAGDTGISPNKPFFYPILNTHPAKGNQAALGLDLSAHPRRQAAMERAVENGKAEFLAEMEDSERLPLIRKTNGEGCFLILVPAYRKGQLIETADQRKKALVGFLVGAFHAQDFMRYSMWAAPSIGISSEFLDLSAPLERQTVYKASGVYDHLWITHFTADRPKHLVKFSKAGHEFGLKMAADNTYLQRFYPIGHFIVLPCGLLLTLFASLYIHATLSFRARKQYAAKLAADNKTLVTEVSEHKRWEEKLRRHGDVLERLVNERTIQLLLNNTHLAKEIAERKRAEEEIRRSRDEAEAANRAKDQFIAVLSHELRTPLTPVLAAITALKAQENLPAETRRILKMISRNVELEAKLIDDLLDVTRISRGKIELRREAVDAHSVLQAALDIFQCEISEKKLAITLNLCARKHIVWADPARLCQVFWNLLKNAVKFTPKNGRIDLRSVSTNGRLRIEFADTGIGLEPEVMPRIFNAFDQGEHGVNRRFGGLGLGLSIAKAVVEMHGGNLTAISAGKGLGAMFAVELNTISVSAQSSDPTSTPLSCSEQKWKILLVDDHADTLHIMERLLIRCQYDVTTATSVTNALEQASAEHFDILVSDLGLPDGSGRDIMRELKKRYGLRGVAISGFGSDEDIRQSRDAGFEAHIVKPVRFDCLHAAIQQILESPNPKSAIAGDKTLLQSVCGDIASTDEEVREEGPLHTATPAAT